METNDGIKVRVFDLAHGLVEYDDIKFIRIVSKEYNLLIMKDYMPIIGEIDGSISIKNEEREFELRSNKSILCTPRQCVQFDDKRFMR